MAELHSDNGIEAPDSLGVYLREALTDEYVVVVEPIVRGHQIDAVVVGPQGLVVLQPKDWEGEIRPVRGRPWRACLASGRVVKYPNPGRESKRASEVLRAFLKDEFPSLRPAIHHFVVLANKEARLAVHGQADHPCAKMEDLAREIDALVAGAKQAPLDRDLRSDLAVALLDRQLTVSQRAAQPFIFRSSGLLGIGKKAWTIRQVIAHMDKFPDDGVHHLRNGTLERWFADQGAIHLCDLARQVMRESRNDPLATLEEFLLRTGLVRRPRFFRLPKRIDMGRVLSGETAKLHLRLRKRRGRVYLFGSVQPTDPWVWVTPDTFGGSLDTVISVDTEELLISHRPHRSEIRLDSSASKEPMSIPIQVRVASMPSPFNRYLVRPLAGLVAGALLGAGVGWSLGYLGIPAPAWLRELAQPPIPSGIAWAALTALFWGLLGVMRGFLQQPAWSIAYATGRWLSKTLVWGTVLSLSTAGVLWADTRLYANAGLNVPDSLHSSIILVGITLAVLPATVGEIWSARPSEDAVDASAEQRTFRRALWGAVGIALVFLMLAGIRFVRPSLDRYGLDTKVASTREWVGERWARFEASLNSLVDQFYIRYHDRRAPARPTPISTPVASSARRDDLPGQGR